MLVGLTVDGDERVDETGKRGRRDGHAARERPGPAFGGDLSGDQEASVLHLSPELLDHGPQVRSGRLEVDQPFDAGGLRSRAH